MKQKSLRRILLRGLCFLILGMVIWIYFQSSYSKLLVWASQKAILWVENKEKTSIVLEGNKVIYAPLRFGLGDKKSGMVGARDIREIHYNSVIFFALIFFSPGLSLKKRIWVLIIGHILLFLTQVLTILVQVKFFYAIQLGEYSQMHYGQFSKNFFTFLKQFFELIGRFSFPFAIWVLFTYRETKDYLLDKKKEKVRRKRKKGR